MQIKFHSKTNVIVECTPDSLALFRYKLEECHPIEWGEEHAFYFKEFWDKLEISLEPYNPDPLLERIKHSRMLMLNCIFDEERKLFSFLLEVRQSAMALALLNPSEYLEKAFNTNGNKLFFLSCIFGRDKYTKINYITNDNVRKYFSI